MDMLIGLAIFSGVVSLIGLISYFNYRKEKIRNEQLGEVAEQLGLFFSPDGTQELLDRLSQFQLFNLGHSRKMSNLIAGDTEEVAISIFDYKYTVGTGKQQQTNSMTVAAIKSPELRCPEFGLRPEKFIDRFGALLGYQDINFDSNPQFSKMFVLQGPDETAIREFMTPALLQFFEANPGITVIAEQGTLLFYWQGKRAKPEELKDFFAKSYEVYGRVVEAVSR
jgi:hypothetical protein